MKCLSSGSKSQYRRRPINKLFITLLIKECKVFQRSGRNFNDITTILQSGGIIAILCINSTGYRVPRLNIISGCFVRMFPEGMNIF